jgi:hypothetical protein
MQLILLFFFFEWSSLVLHQHEYSVVGPWAVYAYMGWARVCNCIWKGASRMNKTSPFQPSKLQSDERLHRRAQSRRRAASSYLGLLTSWNAAGGCIFTNLPPPPPCPGWPGMEAKTPPQATPADAHPACRNRAAGAGSSRPLASFAYGQAQAWVISYSAA